MSQRTVPHIEVLELDNFKAEHILSSLHNNPINPVPSNRSMPYVVHCPLALKEAESDEMGAAAMGIFFADFIASTEYNSPLGRGVSTIIGCSKLAAFLRGAVVSTNTNDPVMAINERIVNRHLKDPGQRGSHVFLF